MRFSVGGHFVAYLYHTMRTHAMDTNSRLPNRSAILRLEARMAEEMELIGGRMRERREELGLKQREVADRIAGKTEGKDVSRWENAHHRPNSDTLGRIAEALETTVADLYAGPVADRKPQGETPDLMSHLDGGSPALNRIEVMFQELHERLEAIEAGQGAIVAEILAALEQMPSAPSASEAGQTRRGRR
jgi:transcriptional regulator with XRE-family HTH domain